MGAEESESSHVPVHRDLDVSRTEVHTRKTGKILGQKLRSSPSSRNLFNLRGHGVAVTVVNLDDSPRRRIVWIENSDAREIGAVGSDLSQRQPALESRC